VEELQHVHEDHISEPTLGDVVEYLHERHPSFAVEPFVRGDDEVRSRVLNADGELQAAALTDGDVHHSPTVFQLEAILYHAGILTTRGAEPSRLDPATDVWALRESVTRRLPVRCRATAGTSSRVASPEELPLGESPEAGPFA
jgi:hypothetical protein